MREIWQHIAELDPSRENVLLTSLNEENLGKKVLFIDGEKCAGAAEFRSEFLPFGKGKRGLVSLGERQFFLDPMGGEKKLIVLGAGHVALSVIRLGKMLGFQVLCIEDRPSFAKAAEKAGADQVQCEDFATALSTLKGDKDSYFVIVTRGHTHDLICLREILKKSHAYIGMIGSKRRGKLVKQIAIENGAPKEVIEKLYTPIGLDIGGETPAEIAISILAQIIQVKSQMPQSGYTREIQKTLDGQREKMVMATIISRKGSAPRAIGTKMLIAGDGKCVGTIGGGCAESEIIRKAQRMLQIDMAPCRFFVDMTGEDAEEEGMACGGTIEVFLEKI